MEASLFALSEVTYSIDIISLFFQLSNSTVYQFFVSMMLYYFVNNKSDCPLCDVIACGYYFHFCNKIERHPRAQQI
jgi:hypothetical protein